MLVLVFNKYKTKYLTLDFVTKSYTNIKKKDIQKRNLPELLKKKHGKV